MDCACYAIRHGHSLIIKFCGETSVVKGSIILGEKRIKTKLSLWHGLHGCSSLFIM